jgi:hypothetical protein
MWRTADIYETSALIIFYDMTFITLLPLLAPLRITQR